MRTRAHGGAPGRWLALACLLGSLFVPGAVDAQRAGDRPDREQIEQRIRVRMGRMMQERLGLNQEEATRLSEVVSSFEERRRALVRQEFETRRRVDALLSADGDEAEARELLSVQVRLRLQEAELFAEEQEALLEVLSPAQVLELQDLRQDIGRRIRALRNGGRDQPPGGPRGPGPDGRRGDRDGPRGPAPLG